MMPRLKGFYLILSISPLNFSIKMMEIQMSYRLLLSLCFSFSMFANEVTVSATSLELGGNVFEAGNVLDGKRQTRWSSRFEDNQILLIEFKNPLPAEKLTIIWENAYASEYMVSITEDNKKCYAVYGTIDKNTNAQDEIKLDRKYKIKQLKIDCLKRATVYCFSIFEILFDDKSFEGTIISKIDPSLK